jgi:preprotein translocase subunit SecG
MSILIGIATFVLILISLFLILVVLAQKAKSDGGMGAAMGGGMAEAAFGAETGNVLSKATINAAIAFFLLSFMVYLGQVYQHKHGATSAGALPNIPISTLPPAPLPTLPQTGAPTSAPAAGPVATPTPTPAPATTSTAPITPPATAPVPAPVETSKK